MQFVATLNYLDLASKLFTRATCIVFEDMDDEPENVLKQDRGKMLLLIMQELFDSEFIERIFRENFDELKAAQKSITPAVKAKLQKSDKYEKLNEAVLYMVRKFIQEGKEFDLTSDRWNRVKNDLETHLARRDARK